MSFLAPFLFALAGFAAVPVLLHLIRRKRVRILDFPTFRFLQKAALQQRLHLRLQDQLLMLLRILVILLLVLAFVGPLTSRPLETEGPVLGIRNLLILDDSLSMSAKNEIGETLFANSVGIARTLTERTRADWNLVFASEIDAATGAGSPNSTRADEFLETAANRSLSDNRLSIYETARRASAAQKEDTVVWVLTDAAASNFPKLNAEPIGGEKSLNFLVVDPPANLTNWAIRNLSLNNQPLLQNEPALVTAVFDRTGPLTEGPRPLELEIAWTTRNPSSSQSQRFPFGKAEENSGRIQTALEVSGQIASVTSALRFAGGAEDAVLEDNTVEIFPRVLGDVKVTLLAESEPWRRLLGAALVDFSVEFPDPSQAPPEFLDPPSAFVILLSGVDFNPEWWNLVRSRLEAGAGALILYDDRPMGGRMENWSNFWTKFGERIDIHPLESGPKTASGGANPWFAQSLQDILMTELDWAVGELELVSLVEGRGEWFLSGGSGANEAIFQTVRKGEGLLASLATPLSLEVSPLILEPHWVPLLSQMVKRTLFDPESTGTLVPTEVWAAESDLTPLQEEIKQGVSASGIRFVDADRFVADVEKIPSRSHDWTWVCLLACIGLAVLEIALSNLL